MNSKYVRINGYPADHFKRHFRLSEHRDNPFQLIHQRIHTVLEQEIHRPGRSRFGNNFLKGLHDVDTTYGIVFAMGSDVAAIRELVRADRNTSGR